MSRQKLLVNKAQCKNCGDIIQSKNRHDFVACSCYVSTDKACEEFKLQLFKEQRIKPEFKCWSELNEINKDRFFTFCKEHQRGIFIDGGTNYYRYGGNLRDFIDLSEWQDDK